MNPRLMDGDQLSFNGFVIAVVARPRDFTLARSRDRWHCRDEASSFESAVVAVATSPVGLLFSGIGFDCDVIAVVTVPDIMVD